ncbi:kelch-like protein 9 isoform X1 [Branchiostoma floridae x Branchiostoma belcheri]
MPAIRGIRRFYSYLGRWVRPYEKDAPKMAAPASPHTPAEVQRQPSQKGGAAAAAKPSALAKHAHRLLTTLNKLRKEGVLCDVTFVCDAETVHAHRVILVSTGSNFKEILQQYSSRNATENDKSSLQDFRGATKIEIDLRGSGLTASAVDKAVEYAYLSDIELLRSGDARERQEIAKVARYFKLLSVEQAVLKMADNVPALCEPAKMLHVQGILKHINQFRNDGFMYDATLICGKEQIPTHKIMLAALSDYFLAMFSAGMRETSSQVIEVGGIEGKLLRKVVDFVYTSDLELTTENVQEILHVGSYLQSSLIVEPCCEFLKKHIDMDNCADFYPLTKTYNLVDLEEAVDKFVSDNIIVLSNRTQFQKLELGKLVEILSRDSLRVMSEVEVFGIAMKWLHHDVARWEHMNKILECVRFPLLPPQQMMMTVAREWDLVKKDSRCVALLKEATRYHNMVYRQPVLETPRASLRSDYQCVVTLGGIVQRGEDEESCEDVTFLDTYSQNSAWKDLAQVEQEVSYHCAAVLNNFVYIAGGEAPSISKLSSHKLAINTVWRYDPGRNQWLSVASMQEARSDFSLVTVGNHLYAICGRNKTPGELFTVERYDPLVDEWKYVKRAYEPVFGHAGAALQGKILVSGGGRNKVFHNRVHSYDTALDEWSEKAPLLSPRAFHRMATVGEKVFAIGGYKNRLGPGFPVNDVVSVEFYNMAENQWSVVAPMLEPQTGAGVAVLDDSVYVVGGRAFSTTSSRRSVRLNTVTKYDTKRNRWERCSSLKQPLRGAACCTLRLPQRLFSMSRLITTV